VGAGAAAGGDAERVTPTLATITQPIANHSTAPSCSSRITKPASAAAAGYRLIRTPKTFAGMVRSAASSRL
jgi:hypothetical protein